MPHGLEADDHGPRFERESERRGMVRAIRDTYAAAMGGTGHEMPDARVMAVMEAVPRHLFVPPEQQDSAYRNRPLPIGEGQTISQPFIVALMTSLVRPTPESRVLEVGTGSGYQAAVLAALVRHVYSIEIVAPLAEAARRALDAAGVANVTTRVGDGYQGWPDEAPFDAVLVTAAPDHIPPALVAQLKPGGRLVIPVGNLEQDLMVIEKAADGSTSSRTVIPVRFVPLTREGDDGR